jgi:hypothetical protein
MRTSNEATIKDMITADIPEIANFKIVAIGKSFKRMEIHTNTSG